MKVYFGCSQKDKLQMKDFWFISMIYYLLVKSQTYIQMMKKIKLLIMSDLKSKLMVFQTQEKIVGNGSLTRLEKIYI
jgi:hypothetical protein